MGCGISKPEDGVDSPAAGRPLHRRFDDIRRLRLGGTRGRKNSTVSNAHLLKPEEDEDVSAAEASTEEPCTSEIICNFSVCTACGSRLSHPAETGEDIIPVTLRPQPNALESESEGEKLIEVCEVAAEEKEETGAKDNFLKTNEIEEEEKEEESEKAHICGGRSGLICDEDDLPGSPSFRVYFVGVAEEGMEEESQDNDDTTRGNPRFFTVLISLSLSLSPYVSFI